MRSSSLRRKIPRWLFLQVYRIAAAGAFILASGSEGVSQRVFLLDGQNEHIFSFDEIEIFRDRAGNNRSFEEILKLADQNAFQTGTSSTPQVLRPGDSDWFRIHIRRGEKGPDKRYLLEFFDQTIDFLAVYIPREDGGYDRVEMGDRKPFRERGFEHKNFTVSLDDPAAEGIYYFNIRSSQVADVIIVLRSSNRFIKYALVEYLVFGIFYGMILVFSFYNFLMYLAIRQEQYLYYVLYILSVGLFEMCVDGLAYQYLWPDSPAWNEYAYAVALFGVSIFALQFSRSLLFTRKKAPRLDKVILVTMGLRALLFCYGLFFDRTFFNYKFIELGPLAIAFYAGVYIYLTGYHPARYFVWGYSFLTLGFVYKLLILFIPALNFGIVSYYSLSICFVIEMLFLSFALGDKVRYLKTKKDKMQGEMIRQMNLNVRLKDRMNARLEKEVADRTREVTEQAAIIENKNRELTRINVRLEQQAEEIRRMNSLLQEDNQVLQQDNTVLKANVEEVTRARVLSVEVDFEEFRKIYPDQDACLRFLEKLKEKRGYACHKCGNDHYYHGHIQGSRRCSKCSYEESVTAHTLLQNTRIPINKAFYIIFLVYSTKGKISSYKLSEALSIRQSTCWAYSSRIKKVMQDHKKQRSGSDEPGWTSLLFAG